MKTLKAFWVTDMFYDSFSLSLKEKRLTRVDEGAPHNDFT